MALMTTLVAKKKLRTSYTKIVSALIISIVEGVIIVGGAVVAATF
jgi:hypothetical protein